MIGDLAVGLSSFLLASSVVGLYVCTLNDVWFIICSLCEVAIVSQLFIPFLFITWDCVKRTLLVTKPQCCYASQSCFDTWEI